MATSGARSATLRATFGAWSATASATFFTAPGARAAAFRATAGARSATLRATFGATSARLLYANHTPSNTMYPGAGGRRASGRAGDSTSTFSSSSLKIRSEDAIADCRMLNFSERSLMGRKNRCAYCTNATTAPIVMVP